MQPSTINAPGGNAGQQPSRCPSPALCAAAPTASSVVVVFC